MSSTTKASSLEHPFIRNKPSTSSATSSRSAIPPQLADEVTFLDLQCYNADNEKTRCSALLRHDDDAGKGAATFKHGRRPAQQKRHRPHFPAALEIPQTASRNSSSGVGREGPRKD
uniref:(northern house mosquito) hypothetical protein n=1 Tax=Culex pipiens TaxID=7175 RepID=A0A8D7ZX70_CULPI